jgi:cation diffusion facilitator CzcD-associated flavoprotein CzcO
VLHTHEYRDPEPFKGQTVLVVGFGDSAIDAAVEISRINPKVTMFLSYKCI